MFKSFEYMERKLDIDISEDSFSKHEKMIAMKYVVDHPSKINTCNCPVCDYNNSKYFFERWDVKYLYCENCGSVFAPVDYETISGYSELSELTDFRNSVEYQSHEETYKGNLWNETIRWLKFRSYRYLKRNKSLNIVDIGNKYKGFSDRLYKTELSGNYELLSIRDEVSSSIIHKADIVLYFNQIKHEINPLRKLKEIRSILCEGGILVFSLRLGSGFDILTLKGGTSSIFPYEHVTLPSIKGIEILMKKSGYDLLEITTPGTQDVEVVLNNIDKVEESNSFIKYFFEIADEGTKKDFQQFLQKSYLSSFARVIARKALL